MALEGGTVWTKEVDGYCRVYKLSLDKRELIGGIPTEVGDLEALEELNLSKNHLSGMIPPELGNLSRLKVLGLNQNPTQYESLSLSGEFPPELGNLGELRLLNLFDNPRLVGELPPEFGNLANLEHLKLENTGFTGCMPPPLVGNFADPLATQLVAQMLAFGATKAITKGKDLPFQRKKILGPIFKKTISTVLDPFIKPGIPSPIPFVGSELHNVKLYCD